MARAKIAYVLLDKLVREGNSVSQIAKIMKVSKGSVSKALKRLNVAVTREAALREAPQIVQKNIDAMGQLININNLINKELARIEEALRVTPEQQRKQLRDQKLKHVGEIRRQIGLLLDIAQTLYNAEEVRIFQETVLEAIGKVSPELRNEVMHELQARRAIRSTLDLC